MIDPLLLTLRVAAVALLLVCIPGIAIGAWLARTRARVRLVVETVVMLPLVLPPVATGVALLLILAHTPILNAWPLTWFAAAIATAVISLPLMIRSVQTAVRAVDPDLEGVARTLGANRWRVFRSITLPLAWKGILAGGLLSFCRGLGEFGATMIVGGNIPGQTRTLALAIFTYAETGRDGQALELVGISAALAFLILILARRVEGA